MKIAVVYYSLNGNCALIAEELKAKLDADLLRLHTEDEKPRNSFAKFFWAIGVMRGSKKAPLKPYTFNPSAYDLIIIGAPVWAGAPARPIRAFLAETGITGKKIALFVCHGGGAGKALEKFKALLPGNDIAAERDFIVPVKNSEKGKQQAADWAKGLVIN
jgi:flavodoxin